MVDCCSPAMKMVAKISGIIASLGSIHLGLTAMGRDPLALLKLHEYSRELGYLFGLAGLVSLVMLILWCMKGERHCCNPSTMNNTYK